MSDHPLQVTPGIAPRWDGDLDESTWTRVEGGSLDSPIYIRIAQTEDGRGVINGLVMGAAWPRGEITARSLRQIRVGEILRKVFDGFSLDDPPDYEDLEEQITWGLMHETYVRQAEKIFVSSRAGTRSAPKDELEHFADVYLDQLKRNAHRAMSATAELLNMSRATANRRAAACRESGLLPPRTSP